MEQVSGRVVRWSSHEANLVHTRGQCGLYLDPQDCRGFKLFVDRPCRTTADRLELLHYVFAIEKVFQDVGLAPRMTIEGGEVRVVCVEPGLIMTQRSSRCQRGAWLGVLPSARCLLIGSGRGSKSRASGSDTV